MNWQEFKKLVHEMRRLNQTITRENGGSNAVTVDICVINMEIMDWVYINPWSVDLRTGKGTIYQENKYIRNYDIKALVARCHYG